MEEEVNITANVHVHAQVANYNVLWTLIDGLLMFVILTGNVLTICALRLSRRLRSAISNQFVLSLAVSDLIVGLTLPYHLAFYVGGLNLGTDKVWCLLRFVLITLGCCLSIWNLIAIAVDRYIAIVHPLHYGRYMTKTVARSILGFGWVVGFTICSMPLYWNNWEEATDCELAEVLPTYFVAGVITPSFSLIWLVMLVVYWRIWREAAGHARRLRATAHSQGTPSDWKSVQVVLLILGSFSVCWLPFFVVACAQAFTCHNESSPILYKAAFSLAISNSGLNPLIYAWKNSNFRRAFGQLIRCRNPDTAEQHRQQQNQQNQSANERRMTSETRMNNLTLHHQDGVGIVSSYKQNNGCHDYQSHKQTRLNNGCYDLHRARLNDACYDIHRQGRQNGCHDQVKQHNGADSVKDSVNDRSMSIGEAGERDSAYESVAEDTLNNRNSLQRTTTPGDNMHFEIIVNESADIVEIGLIENLTNTQERDEDEETYEVNSGFENDSGGNGNIIVVADGSGTILTDVL